jgi:hypothetical protein
MHIVTTKMKAMQLNICFNLTVKIKTKSPHKHSIQSNNCSNSNKRSFVSSQCASTCSLDLNMAILREISNEIIKLRHILLRDVRQLGHKYNVLKSKLLKYSQHRVITNVFFR